MRHMLVRVGWKDKFVEASVPIIPISGWMGDNLIKPSENMKWWTGVNVTNQKGESVKVATEQFAGKNNDCNCPKQSMVPIV